MAPDFAPAAILPVLAAVAPLMPGDTILLAATRYLIDGSDWSNTGMPSVALIASEHVWTSFLLSAPVLVHPRSAEPSVASRKARVRLRIRRSGCSSSLGTDIHGIRSTSSFRASASSVWMSAIGHPVSCWSPCITQVRHLAIGGLQEAVNGGVAAHRPSPALTS